MTPEQTTERLLRDRALEVMELNCQCMGCGAHCRDPKHVFGEPESHLKYECSCGMTWVGETFGAILRRVRG